jgi:hypothetical protein
LNRGVARTQLFEKPAGNQAFERVMRETLDESSITSSEGAARPFGPSEWQKGITKQLGLESAYRPTGRPRETTLNRDAAAQ